MQILLNILKGLFYREGKFSHTLFWSNIGYAVFTWAIITKVINNTASDELFLIYIGVVTAHTSFSKYLAGKQLKEDSK
jgi:hypothetical protein